MAFFLGHEKSEAFSSLTRVSQANAAYRERDRLSQPPDTGPGNKEHLL